jgi:hypothetical protein
VSCCRVSFAHCTASTALASSTKRLSPAEPTTRPLNDFQINELDPKFVEVGKRPCLIQRHQTGVTRDVCGQYGSFGSATQGRMAGFRVSNRGAHSDGGRSAVVQISEPWPNGSPPMLSTVRQVGELLK